MERHTKSLSFWILAKYCTQSQLEKQKQPETERKDASIKQTNTRNKKTTKHRMCHLNRYYTNKQNTMWTAYLNVYFSTNPWYWIWIIAPDGGQSGKTSQTDRTPQKFHCAKCRMSSILAMFQILLRVQAIHLNVR